MPVDTVQMPKPNPRPPGAEDFVAKRIARERTARGWSTAELARRVSEAGCALNQSAVWRIERGEPRRTISLDEAVAFAKVFGITLEELLQPTIDPDLYRLGREFHDWHAGFETNVEQLSKIARKARSLVVAAQAGQQGWSELPALADRLSEIVRQLAAIDDQVWSQINTLGNPGEGG